MVRRGRLALIALLVTFAVSVAVPAAAAARPDAPSAIQQVEDPDGDPSTNDTPVPEQDIIPEPNSGRAPEDAGDRGGVLQGVVLLLVVAGVGLIAARVVRESRHSRARRNRDPSETLP